MHPALDLDRLSVLPYPLRLRAKLLCLKGESVSVVKQLDDYVRANILDPVALSGILPILYSLLDPARIPHENDFNPEAPTDTDDETRLDTALTALTWIKAQAVLVPAADSDVGLLVWQRVWRWLAYLLRFRDTLPVMRDADAEASVCRSALDYAGNLALPLQGRQSVSTLVATPGLFRVLARAWPAQRADDAGQDRSANIGAISMFLANAEPIIDRAVLELAEGAGSVRALARLIVLHVSAALQEFEQGKVHIDAVLGVLQFLDDVVVQPRAKPAQIDLLPSLSAVGAPKVLLGTLRTLVRHAQAHVQAEDAEVMLIRSIQFVTRLLETTFEAELARGRSRLLTDALWNGILRILVDIAALGLDVVIARFLQVTLPASATRPRCIGAWANVHEDVQPPVGTEAGSTVSADWAALSKLFEDHARVLGGSKVHANHFQRLVRCCHNLSCLRRDLAPPARMRRCSGCKEFWYCSRDCQVADWRLGGHRNACEHHAVVHLYNNRPYRAFLRALLVYKFGKHAMSTKNFAYATAQSITHITFAGTSVSSVVRSRADLFDVTPSDPAIPRFLLPAWEDHFRRDTYVGAQWDLVLLSLKCSPDADWWHWMIPLHRRLDSVEVIVDQCVV
ncbi:MYND-type domain-containing protein [Mycena kentingensis (nom. inval.)]|nr:MYND-type domain-containing protein [Mycena kentingensis (nom. inval.)]